MTDEFPDEDVVWEIYDVIPDDLELWPHGDELAAGHFRGRDYDWWRDTLGHPRAHPGCCKTCGCATTCLLGTFYESVAVSVIRELVRQGLIRGVERSEGVDRSKGGNRSEPSAGTDPVPDVP